MNGLWRPTFYSSITSGLAAAKTRCGLTARVKAGFSGGGRCYGYDIIGKGELQPNTHQTGILHQIFVDFGRNGMSARTIAHKLNAAGEPGPRGGEWTPSTIHGDRRAQDGILHQSPPLSQTPRHGQAVFGFEPA